MLTTGVDAVHGPGPVVLIISSVPSGLRLLAQRLSRRKCRAQKMLAKTVTLAIIQSAPISLVLLSVVLPSASNCTIYRTLGTSPGARSVPIVFVDTLSRTVSGIGTFALNKISCVAGPFGVIRIVTHVRARVDLQRTRGRLRRFGRSLRRRIAGQARRLTLAGRALRTRVRVHRGVRDRLHCDRTHCQLVTGRVKSLIYLRDPSNGFLCIDPSSRTLLNCDPRRLRKQGLSRFYRPRSVRYVRLCFRRSLRRTRSIADYCQFHYRSKHCV